MFESSEIQFLRIHPPKTVFFCHATFSMSHFPPPLWVSSGFYDRILNVCQFPSKLELMSVPLVAVRRWLLFSCKISPNAIISATANALFSLPPADLHSDCIYFLF